MSSLVWADEVVLTDDSILNGKITSIDQTTVHLAHEILGDLNIAREHIKLLQTDEKVACKLPGEVIALQPLEVGTPQGMEEMSGFQTMWLPEEEDPDVIAYNEEVERNRRKWLVTLGVNFSGDRGNTEKNANGINATVVLKGPNDKFKAYLHFDETAYDNTKTQDESIMGASYDRYFGEELGLYIRSELERDYFESIDLRSTSATGVTYKILERENLSFTGRLGLSYRYEDYISDTYSTYPGGDLGYELEWEFFSWLNFVHEFRFLPSFEDFSDFVVKQNTGIEIPLNEDRKWFLQIGLTNDYNNVPTDDDDALDTNYYTRLILKWE